MSDTKIKLYVKPYFDKGHREHLNCLFFRDPVGRVVEVDNTKEADFIVVDSREITQQELKGRFELSEGDRYIIACFGDLYESMGGLRLSDVVFRARAKVEKKVLIYLMCEPAPCKPYSILDGTSSEKYGVVYGGEHIIPLTLPLGYLDGPSINVYYPNNDESYFYTNNLAPNPKNYKYDWSFIGARTSWDRKIIMGKLCKRSGGFFAETKISKETDVQEHIKAIHSDNKTVPHNLYLDICRKSKVCVSLSGWGMFSPRDGEFFSRNCFNLRQYHENLDVNILTPKDGVHWVVFKNDDFEEKLQYYIDNNEERERINDAGHQYFKEGISGKWAERYVDSLEIYLSTGRPDAFGRLRVTS